MPATSVSVRDADSSVWAGSALPNDVRGLRLWSRSWDRMFEVGVTWNTSQGEILKDRVVCKWAERASLPGLEEVEGFFCRDEHRSRSGTTACRTVSALDEPNHCPHQYIHELFFRCLLTFVYVPFSCSLELPRNFQRCNGVPCTC